MNQPSFQGILRLLKVLLIVTFGIELVGALLAFPIFFRIIHRDAPHGSVFFMQYLRLITPDLT